jgi:hypothetical protein
MFISERFRTYRNAYYVDEVGLTETFLQQNIVSFVFVEKTLLNVTIKLLSTSSTTNKNQCTPSFIKAEPK